MSRKRNIMPEEGNNKYQLKEFLMETIGQILLVAFFVGKSLTPHCWAKLCSHLHFGLNQLNLLKKKSFGSVTLAGATRTMMGCSLEMRSKR